MTNYTNLGLHVKWDEDNQQLSVDITDAPRTKHGDDIIGIPAYHLPEDFATDPSDPLPLSRLVAKTREEALPRLIDDQDPWSGNLSERNQAMEMGKQLFESLFSQKGMGNLYSETTGKVRLRLKCDPEVADVPWEVMAGSPGYPCADNFLALEMSVTREPYFNRKPLEPYRTDLPLKVLLVGDEPYEMKQEKIEEEIRELKDRLRHLDSIELVTLEKNTGESTLDAVGRCLADDNYQILHFMGEGDFQLGEEKGEGYLQTTRGGRASRVPAKHFAEIVARGAKAESGLRLVVLNACEGARGQKYFRGVAQALVDEGIPAVVAMQYELSEVAAVIFSTSFYENLARTLSVDEAMCRARFDLSRSIAGTLEWLTPVLFLGGEGRILELTRASITPERIEEIRTSYLAKAQKKWETITVESGAQIQLSHVYMMLQVVGSERHTKATERPDVLQEEERLEHSGLKDFPEKEEDGQNSGGKDPTDKADLPETANLPVPLSKALKDVQYMALLGEPGAGKSVSLKYVGLHFASGRNSALIPDLREGRIPVLLSSLKPYSELLQTEPLEAALASEIRNNMRGDASREEALACIQSWGRSGQLAVLLDGLDEVPDISEEYRDNILQAILDFSRSESGKKCRVIVTSRIASYQKDLGDPFVEYELKPFAGQEPFPYVASWLAVLDSARYIQPAVAREKADWLVNELKEGPSLEQISDNPLLLRMVVETYVKTGEVISDRYEIYHRYVNNVKVAAKNRGADEALLGNADKALMDLAWEMQTSAHDLTKWQVNQPEPMLSMLREKVGLLIYEGSIIAFRHRTFREYFVASHLNRMWTSKEEQERAWDLLKPRLHHPDWREPIFLLASSLKESDSEELIRRILAANSPFERELHRDLNLAGALIGRGYGARATDVFPIEGEVQRLLSERRNWHRLAVLWLVFLVGLVAPVGFRSWWAVALVDVSWVILWFVMSLGYLPPIAGLFWWPSRLAGGPGKHERLALIDKLPEYGSVALQTLAQVLQKGKEAKVRKRAALALGQMGEVAIPALTRLLNDQSVDEELRRSAAWALREMGKAAIPALVQALQRDNSWMVRHVAAAALGQIGDRVAGSDLIHALQNAPQEKKPFRVQVVAALGELGDPNAVPVLANALEDEDEDFLVRFAATQALGQIGSPDAVEALNHIIGKKDSYIQYQAIMALGQIGSPEALKALIDLLDHQSAAAALAQIGEAAVPALLQAVQTDNAVDSRAVHRQAREMRKVRSNAAKALGQIGDRQAVPVLIHALQKDEVLFVRMEAAKVLGQIGDPQAAPALIHALEKDEEPSVRREAATALGQISSPEAMQALHRALGNGDSWLQVVVADALLPTGDPEPVQQLIKALQEGDDFVRRKAAAALGRTDDSKAVPALIQTLQKDEDLSARREAAKALGQIGDPQAVPALIHALQKDEEPSVRRGAAKALGQIGDPQAVPALDRALDEDDLSMQTNAIEALSKLRTPAAVWSLFDSSEGRGWLLSTRAAEALGQVGKVALPILMQALRANSPSTRAVAAKALIPTARYMNLAQVQETIRWTRWLSHEPEMYSLLSVLVLQLTRLQTPAQTD